jgi:hypothetical protein
MGGDGDGGGGGVSCACAGGWLGQASQRAQMPLPRTAASTTLPAFVGFVWPSFYRALSHGAATPRGCFQQRLGEQRLRLAQQLPRVSFSIC